MRLGANHPHWHFRGLVIGAHFTRFVMLEQREHSDFVSLGDSSQFQLVQLDCVVENVRDCPAVNQQIHHFLSAIVVFAHQSIALVIHFLYDSLKKR